MLYKYYKGEIIFFKKENITPTFSTRILHLRPCISGKYHESRLALIFIL